MQSLKKIHTWAQMQDPLYIYNRNKNHIMYICKSTSLTNEKTIELGFGLKYNTQQIIDRSYKITLKRCMR